MEVSIGPVLAATVAMFAVGAFWYSVPFRQKWSQIHGFDKLSKKEQQSLMADMGATYAVQLFVTLISAYVLLHCMNAMPEIASYKVAFWLWLGFVMPSQVSAVLFSRTEKQYKYQQICIMAGEALLRLLVAAWVIRLF